MSEAGPPRVVVLASGSGTNFGALRSAIEADRCHARIVGLVSDREKAGALQRAARHGIPTAVLPKPKGETRDEWSARLAERVRSYTPDLVVLAGFMRVLGPAFVDAFPGRVVNVHPSLLPAFPGIDAPAQAVAAGVRLSGCTVHLVDHGVDTGAILAQAAVPVLEGDDAASLHQRIQVQEHHLLPRVIDAIGRGHLALDPVRWLRTATGPDAVLVAP